MRTFLIAFLLGVVVTSLAQTPPATTTLKVKIEATEMDKALLLSKLNQHGPSHGLKFELADKDYDYRIVFATSQASSFWAALGSGGAMNVSGARTQVFDAQGRNLFAFQRAGRATDAGATNAVAKEIIKRLTAWRHEHDGQGSTKP